MAYVHFGGWLPKTDKYLEQKYIRGAENHEKLDLLDEGLEKRLEKRRELRKLWMSYDGNKTWAIDLQQNGAMIVDLVVCLKALKYQMKSRMVI